MKYKSTQLEKITNEIQREFGSNLDDHDSSDLYEYYSTDPMTFELSHMNFDSYTIQSQLMTHEF